jgi:hypothetical protein
MTLVVSHDRVPGSDLIVGTVYLGNPQGTVAQEPISRLCGVGNFGGFRAKGAWSVPGATLVVLFTTESEHEWPDRLDRTTGRFEYYGDNREPRPIEESLEGRKGNRLLRQTFDCLADGRRDRIPPFFVFRSANDHGSRAVEFLGLAVPGGPGGPASDDLVAIWSTGATGRFINYRARFTVLDEPAIRRSWVARLGAELSNADGAPDAWRSWVIGGSMGR